jgi:hypothetical protein
MPSWSVTFSVKMAYPFGMRPPCRVNGLNSRFDHYGSRKALREDDPSTISWA